MAFEWITYYEMVKYEFHILEPLNEEVNAKKIIAVKDLWDTGTNALHHDIEVFNYFAQRCILFQVYRRIRTLRRGSRFDLNSPSNTTY